MGLRALWPWIWGGIAWLLLVACGASGGSFDLVREDTPTSTAVPGATREAERLVPTVLVSPIPTRSSVEDIPSPYEEIASDEMVMTPGLWRPQQRIGVGVPFPPIERYAVVQLGIGWYYAWRVLTDLPTSSSVEAWQMVRASEDGFTPSREVIVAAAQAYSGSTWLIGNEPDVIWQDNVTSERYAQIYHDVYYLLKEVDPTCRVAAGGISQPTLLRLRYLEQVLQAYQELYGERMPVDLWHIHNFILREERGSWGVDIPPGLDEAQGVLVEVQDNDNLSIFQEQVVAFRRWMAEQGERDKPLVISEYGIPMPVDYGFDFARVYRFMTTTMDFLLTAADPQLGYVSDGYRLVQRWAWFSMGDAQYPTGNLADLETGELTPLGRALGAYIRRFP